MSSELEVLEKIRSWLKREPVKSSWHPADQGWETEIVLDERIGSYILKAKSKRLPFELTVFVLPSKSCVRLTVSSGIETENLDKSLKALIYRELLVLNSTVELVKYVIVKPRDTLAVAVDIEIKALNEQLFRDSLLAVFAGLIVMIEHLGLAELLPPIARGALERLHEKLVVEYNIPSPMDFITRVHIPKTIS